MTGLVSAIRTRPAARTPRERIGIGSTPRSGDLAVPVTYERLPQLGVGTRHGELREIVDHVLRRAEQDAGIGCGEHGGVVVGVTRGDDAKGEVAQRLDGAPLAVLNAQPVPGDAPAAVHLERVADT